MPGKGDRYIGDLCGQGTELAKKNKINTENKVWMGVKLYDGL